MKLTIADRLNIIYGGLIPAKGNMSDMAIASEIKDKIKFGSEEIEKIGLEDTESGKIKWNDEYDKEEFECDFKPKELVFLDKQVSELDSKNEIGLNIYDLCKRIKESVWSYRLTTGLINQ